MPLPSDTIVALATPPGRGALAVVRLSGADAHDVAGRLISPWPLPPRVASLCLVRDPSSGVVLDRALVTTFEGTRSYTGEPAVELSTHGGYAVPASVIAAMLAAGAREALPGEFTRRAVLNGKIDIVQAEATGDLVDARSQAMQRTALAQLDGGLSRRIALLRERLLETEALLAYDIDFPEEDDGPVSRQRISGGAASVVASLDELLATAPMGEMVREGAVVVIAGPPNAGKSSLFNAMLGQARAIVTEQPGTTRDAVEAVVDAGSWPLRLVDTAGLREAGDVVERLGIEVSERYLAAAHLVLVCADDDAGLHPAVARVTRHAAVPVVMVRTKADLIPAGDRPGSNPARDDAIVVSAETGAGLAELRQAIVARLADRYGAPEVDVPLVTRTRHRYALEKARQEVWRFLEVWEGSGLPATVSAVHVRTAVGALEELIGVVDVEDVLERVFSTFCVGK